MLMTPVQLRETLSRNIKTRRKQLKMTQETLAENTGLAVQTINDIEGCRSWVSDKTLTKIADTLKTSPGALLVPYSPKESGNDFSETEFALAELKLTLQKTIGEIIDGKIKHLTLGKQN
ncbi:MAG: helix-turn-helix transcriptional regulator [Treponema sp.]|nr:helix-turn-helix transcriptional regulator [Treponema sp.]